MRRACACRPPLDRAAEAARWLARAGGGALDGVVAKRLDEPYRAGERAMLKIKCLRTRRLRGRRLSLRDGQA